MRRLKLTERIFFWLTGIVVVISTTVSYFEFRTSRKLIIEKSKAELERGISASINHLSSSVYPAQTVAMNAGKLLESLSISDSASSIILKKILRTQNKLFAVAFFFDSTKTDPENRYLYYIRCSDSLNCIHSVKLTDNYIYSVWYQRFDTLNQSHFSNEYRLFELSDSVIYSFIVPFGRGNEKIQSGFVKFDFPEDSLFQPLLRYPLMSNAKVVIYNNKGRIINHINHAVSGNTKMFDKIENTDKLWLHIQEGERGFLEKNIYEKGKSVYLLYIEEFNVYVAYIIPLNDLTRELRIHYTILSIISLSAIILASFLILSIARRLLKPLIKLSEAAQDINKGHLHTSIPEYKVQDEIGSLSNSFKSMQEKMLRFASDFNQTLKEKRKIESDLKFAKRVQASMLPKQDRAFTWCANIDVFAKFYPAKGVAGDFYDYFFVDSDTLFFIIGDVSGKGIPAALFMVKTVTLIKNEARRSKDPAHIFSFITHVLSENNEDSLFVTAICGTMNVISGELILCDAGHNPPVFNLKKKLFRIEHFKKNIPLGIMSDFKYESVKYNLKKGDTLLFYTDGLSEGMNTEGEMFGTDRMLSVLKGQETKELEIIYNNLENSFELFTTNATQSDDITILILRFTGK